jgi:iron complex transport system ATP-binding protein
MSGAAGDILQATDLAFAYRPDEPVLRGVSLSASAGRLTCLLGPNGSGKTTLLRCLMGRLTPSAGRVSLDGRALRTYGPRQLARVLAYVPQQPESSLAFSSMEIVLMGRYAHTGPLGLAAPTDLAVAREAMKMTDTLAFSRRTLDELSGGEAQRVMIARALAQQPRVILLDEPTSHLDIRHQLNIYRMMGRLAHDWPMAVVCVSHDVNVAARHADELVLMRDGQVIAAGPPSETVREDLLSQTYDVPVELIASPGGGAPIVRAR